MKSSLQPHVYPLMQAIVMLLAAVLLFPLRARAECKEFKIVEYEDRVEAVCVGEPLTEAQKKTRQEEERRQEQEAQRQRIEDQRRQSEADRSSKARAEAEAAEERKRRNAQPATPSRPPVTTTNPQIIYK